MSPAPEISIPDKIWPPGTSYDPDKENLLVISSNPAGAEIFLNEIYIGTSPIELVKYPDGFYRIRIVKNGYSEYRSSFFFDEKQNRHHAILSRITGTMKLSVSPAETIILLGLDKIIPGTSSLPAGNYAIEATLFGYSRQSIPVTIRENQTTEVSIVLVPSSFSISGISVLPQKANPRLPGVRGDIVVRFEASGSGKGKFAVRDKGGTIVFEKKLDPFHARYQTVTWNGKDSSQNNLPDGKYKAEITAVSADDSTTSSVTAEFQIAQSEYSGARNITSGAAGLFLLPDSIILSNLRMQADALFMLLPDESGDQASPLFFSFGMGILDTGEATIATSIVMSPSDKIPVSLTASYKHAFVKPAYPGGLGLSGLAKLTLRNTAVSDISANPTGFCAGIPLEIRIGDYGFGISPELYLSWERSSWDGLATYPLGFYASGAARMGMFYDNGAFSAGISFAMFSAPFDSGFVIQFPLYTAAEARFLVPDTSLYISGNAVFLVQENGEIDWSAGVGVSLLW